MAKKQLNKGKLFQENTSSAAITALKSWKIRAKPKTLYTAKAQRSWHALPCIVLKARNRCDGRNVLMQCASLHEPNWKIEME
eukprot:gene10782-11936_t